LRRQNLKIEWYGLEREIPLPGGVAVSSPWMDVTNSSPSCENMAPFDYLPALTNNPYENKFPPCEIWPAKPPRATMYVDDDYLCHPLVTLMMAQSWAGAPPVYMCTGWELLSDEDKFMASKMQADGVTVVFEEYEAMPHCFAMIFTELEGSEHAFRSWSSFISDVVEAPDSVQSSFTTVKAKTLKEVELDPSTLSPYTESEMRERVSQRAAWKTNSANGHAKL
jgi:acetyl esterase/lipase